MHRLLFECLCEVGTSGVLLLRMDKEEEGPADERIGLILEMAGEDGIEIDEGEV